MDYFSKGAASSSGGFGRDAAFRRLPAAGEAAPGPDVHHVPPPTHAFPRHPPPPSGPAPQSVDPRLGHAQQAAFNKPPSSRSPQRSEDERWLRMWLCGVGKASASRSSVVVGEAGKTQQGSTAGGNDMSIREARSCLKNSLSILGRLTQTQQDLQQNVETMSSSEWKRKTIEIGSLKDEFTQAVGKFGSTRVVTSLRRAVEKRRKKRATAKRAKLRRKEDEALEAEKLKKADKDADMWLESMKDQVERAKMEEHFKRDADCILAEVTKKKGDARKQLSLMQAMIKLRSVREQAAVQRGEKVSLEDKQAFEKATGKLVKMWQDMLTVYTKEEQGLRLMLEQTASNDSKAAKTAKENAIAHEWTNLLFGPRCPPPRENTIYWALTAAERDMETFIAIRRSWDTFLVPSSDESGSNIPIGWVIPEPNADKWNKYLVR